MEKTNSKEISFIIPIHNEEAILKSEVMAMINAIQLLLPGVSYEIILVENGSIDETQNIGYGLEQTIESVRMISLKTAGYGKALKYGILEAQTSFIALFNIDLWDIEFIKEALALCKDKDFDIVIGSKTMKGACDKRPFVRKLITRSFNMFLRIFLGFKGTDTHGVKLLRREKIIEIVQECQTDQEVFDTELILRAQKRGLKIKELPVIVREKRITRYSLIKRVPRTLKDLWILRKNLYHAV